MNKWLLKQYRARVPTRIRAPIAHVYRGFFQAVGGAAPSYSAAGEDRLVKAWLDDRAVPESDVRYLDIGGSHPTILSNSFLLYASGGSGVVVEPTPTEAGLHRQQRPRDTLIQAGVAFDNRRTAVLHQFPSSVFNTFSEEAAKETETFYRNAAQKERVIGRIEVPLVPINDLLREHFASGVCHFLTIDAEGVDSLIVRSMDFDLCRPWYVCIERPTQVASETLHSAGYSMLARTPHNTIYALPWP